MLIVEVVIFSSLIGVSVPGVPPGCGDDCPEGVADVDADIPSTSDSSNADFADIFLEFRRRALWCLWKFVNLRREAEQAHPRKSTRW
jgi:hypothetical protein